MSSHAGKKFTVTIVAGQSLSPAFYLGGLRIVGVRIPASFEGPVISFLASDAQGGPFDPVYDDADGEAAAKADLAARHVGLDAIEKEMRQVKFYPWVKVRSGSNGVPIPVLFDRILTISAEE